MGISHNCELQDAYFDENNIDSIYIISEDLQGISEGNGNTNKTSNLFVSNWPYSELKIIRILVIGMMTVASTSKEIYLLNKVGHQILFITIFSYSGALFQYSKI